MTDRFGLKGFRENLREAGVKYAELSLSGGARLLVTGHWGKAFGPFENDSDPGTLWISDTAADPASLRKTVDEGAWCMGGDRLWLAPEVQFNIPDRGVWDRPGGYKVPPPVDPGNYTLSAGDGFVTLEQTVEVELFNLATGTKNVSVQRRFCPARDPLSFCRAYGEIRGSVRYTGYSEESRVEDLSGGGAAVQAWNLIQVRPGGVVVLPLTGAAEYQDYYEPADPDHLRIERGAALHRLTGDRKYKTGWKSAGVTGRIGYYRVLDSGELRLIVRHFFNDPSAEYVDEPLAVKAEPSHEVRGDSVQFYNDDGSLGGFGEIEVHGRSLGPHRPMRSVVHYLGFWQYTGPVQSVRRAGELLLGVPAWAWD